MFMLKTSSKFISWILAKFILVASHLKIHSVVYLNTSKVITSL